MLGLKKTRAEILMQRFDVFFKKAFSRYRDSFLALLTNIIPENPGIKVTQELPVEVIKGALRVDKIFRTNIGTTVLIDFEEFFTFDAYLEIIMHTIAHVRSSKAYKVLLEKRKKNLAYLSLLIALKTNERHMQYLTSSNIVTKVTLGVYQIHSVPFFDTYLLLLSELKLAEYMLKATGLCDTKEACRRLAEQIMTPDFWDTDMERQNIQTKKVLNALLEKFGELVLLLNMRPEFVFRIWRYANRERKEVSKDILESLLILFLKEVKHMSVSQILSKKEKKELIEVMGIKEAIDAIGIERVIDAIGIERVIDAIGIERVINLIGAESVIDTLGIEKIVEILSSKLKLSEHDKKVLQSILSKSKK